MSQPPVPIRIAAQQTGIAIDTIRAWERRYQAVVPTRAKGGRLFSETEIQRLILLKKAVDAGYNIGQIAKLSRAELEASFGENAHLSSQNQDLTLDPGQDQILEYIKAYDAVAADNAMGKLAALLGPRQFCFEVLIPLLNRVGQDWHLGHMNMAQEHMASNLMRSLVGTLLRMHQPSPFAPKAICSSPSGEFHEFGILAATLLLLSSGCYPIYLGPNLPAKEIAAAVQQTQARILVLGVRPQAEICQETQQEITSIHGALPAGTSMFVGGGNYSESTEAALTSKGILYPKNFQDFETMLNSVLKN